MLTRWVRQHFRPVTERRDRTTRNPLLLFLLLALFLFRAAQRVAACPRNESTSVLPVLPYVDVATPPAAGRSRPS